MEPLAENTQVRQRAEEGYRRWFVNSFFDVILWYNQQQTEFYGFQFCYSRNLNEKAFTWTRNYRSNRLVSDTYFEKGVSHMSTGILKGEGGAVPEEVIRRFLEESAVLGPDMQAFMVEKIQDYNSSLK